MKKKKKKKKKNSRVSSLPSFERVRNLFITSFKTVLFILSIYVSLKRCSFGKGQLLDASINVCVVPSSKSSSSGKRQSCYSLYFGFTVYDGMVNGNANLKAKTSLTLRLNPYL